MSIRPYALFGWTGTTLAIVVYGLFALGLVNEIMLFAVGDVASILLVWALIHDRTYYAAALQAAFLLFNIIGIVRILHVAQTHALSTL